jgi:hypothetical protein
LETSKTFRRIFAVEAGAAICLALTVAAQTTALMAGSNSRTMAEAVGIGWLVVAACCGMAVFTIAKSRRTSDSTRPGRRLQQLLVLTVLATALIWAIQPYFYWCWQYPCHYV